METNTPFLGTKADTILRLFISTIFFGQKRKLLVESLRKFKSVLPIRTILLFAISLLLSMPGFAEWNISQSYVIVDNGSGDQELAGGINPDGATVFAGINFGSFDYSTGSLEFNGGEIKTFKNGNSNVCGGSLNYRVHPTGNTPGSFSQIALTWTEDLNGPDDQPGDQKWEATDNIDLLNGLIPGDYTLEVYWEADGNDENATACGETKYDGNGGANFKAFFSVTANVTNITQSINYATIQEAIDDATAEDVISIQAGYVHDGILVTIPKDLTIQGNEVSINAGFNITSGSDVTINNLKIESIASPQGFYAFNTSEGTTISQVSDNSKLTMDGVTISHTMTTGGNKKNLVGFNLTVGGPTLNLNNSTLNLTNESIVYGIYAQSGGPTISVTNTTFNVAITPAELTNRSMNLIGHQFASDNTLANISLSGNTYNTTFSDPTRQKFFEVLLHARPTALTNTQINSYLNGVLTTGQTARVWYSDSQNAGNSNWNVFPGPVHNITSDVYYNTIQAAIDAVETLDGHVISVDAGTYEEGELLVNKELTLQVGS